MINILANVETEYVLEAVRAFLWFVLPIAVLTIVLVLVRIFVKIPDFIFRKILHLIAISMISVLIIVPIHWWISEIVMGICGIGIIVILLIFEHIKFYQKLFIEKGKHEVLISFIVFFIVILCLIAFFWGFRGDSHKYYVIIALQAWGWGDAAASIIGHIWGKHKLTGKFIEGTKSVEGSIGCALFAFTISLILLLTLIHMVWWLAILEALLIGICVSLAELFTKKGMDTITCPIVSAIILFLFSLI